MGDTCIEPGGSLLLAHRLQGKVVLIVGTNRLAATRLVAAANAGAWPVIIPPLDHTRNGPAMDEIQRRYERGECALLPPLHQYSTQPGSPPLSWLELLETLDRRPLPNSYPANPSTTARKEYSDGVVQELRMRRSTPSPRSACAPHVFGVCVTDTLASTGGETTREYALRVRTVAQQLVDLCRSRRIPINVADVPDWCDFTLPATHRFQVPATEATLARASSLQLAVTANGHGCRVAGRIRREMVASVPRNVALAVENIAHLRRLAQQRDRRTAPEASTSIPATSEGSHEPSKCSCTCHTRPTDAGDDEIFDDPTPINSAVPQLPSSKSDSSVDNQVNAHSAPVSNSYEDSEERARRRMRWVAQMSEYWPLEYLGNLDQNEMDRLLDQYELSSAAGPASDDFESQHGLQLIAPSSRGHVYLVGSGPGHPGLLTALARDLLVSGQTDVVLSDKLVPSAVLALVHPNTKVIIARKFPGNAEGAQAELLKFAHEYALQGKQVVRLKQGDPFVYGRGGEEILYLRQRGVSVSVVPGVSSALAGPLALGIPVTQRGAADSMVLATGVGRGGKATTLPGYQRSRSLVLLMGVARIEALVKTLLAPSGSTDAQARDGLPYPEHIPCAVVERATSPDQRLIAAPLNRIVSALDAVGDQRPPGMIMIGWAVLSLEGSGDTTILDPEQDTPELDQARIERWLDGRAYVLREGLDAALAASGNLASQVPGGSIQDVVQRDAHGWAPGRYTAYPMMGDAGTPGAS